ncbi:hypothetical protein [Mesorhizobium caraganae]|uniref:hypothetical protein n=1 Tax=Mesorhizobium caraganae TaxID=483206 RepID=UPI003ED0841D
MRWFISAAFPYARVTPSCLHFPRFPFLLSPSRWRRRAGWSLKNTVYCADDRIEVSFWDLEQMKVRRGSDVCQFQSYTSYSSALNFAQKNFGGEGASCSC